MLSCHNLLELPSECLVYILRYATNFYRSTVNLKKTEATGVVLKEYRTINMLSGVCFIERSIKLLNEKFVVIFFVV